MNMAFPLNWIILRSRDWNWINLASMSEKYQKLLRKVRKKSNARGFVWNRSALVQTRPDPVGDPAVTRRRAEACFRGDWGNTGTSHELNSQQQYEIRYAHIHAHKRNGHGLHFPPSVRRRSHAPPDLHLPEPRPSGPSPAVSARRHEPLRFVTVN